MNRFERVHFGALLGLVVLTAWGSYAYFHIDENFQILQWTWLKLGLVEEWTLPMEHALRMRAWFQPWLYFLVAKAMPTRDIFVLAFVFRLVTGLLSFGALVMFVRVARPWMKTESEGRLFVRMATLLGFLPYLFVRTSSETLSMAAFTAAFALAMEKRFWLAGLLLGVAFEARFQSAFLSLGLASWLVFVARERATWKLVPGGVAMLALGALVDHWGYGAWEFPAYRYFHTNLVEGIAALFGADPPFAYLWMLPANFFLPVVVVLVVAAVSTWIRYPKHPLTWTTLPFFLVHNLLAHKEERFLFPLAIFATAFVPLGFGPSGPARLRGLAAFFWGRRRVATILAVYSACFMMLLAVYPVGWHHHVRFQRYVHDAVGPELHAVALPDFDLGLPAFHARIYDVKKATPEDLLRELDGTPRWLVADTPRLRSGLPALDARATLVWSELPCFRDATLTDRVMQKIDAYDAAARPPLRPLRYRSLYRLQ